MAEDLVVNGTTYNYPDVGDNNWGTDATNWAVAITNGMLQKAGGSFTLTAEVDFGANFGLKSLYYKSRSTNPASSGTLRLGNTEIIGWRNAAANADLTLTTTASNQFQFAGGPILLPDGSVGAPSFSFTNSVGSGIFLISGNSVGIATNSTQRLQIDTAKIISALPFQAPDGTAAAPGFAMGSLTNGIYKFALNSIGFATNGLTAGNIDATQNWSFPAAVTITGTLLSGNITSSAFISQTVNPAGAGAIRLANSDSIKFRNSGNSGDVALAAGSSNSLIAYATIDLVNISTAQTLTNKTLTTPIITTISNTGTITLPTATCTLVGKDTTDTLTNKTLSGNTAVTLISGSGTLTLNTTGTVTLPNATDTLVGKATTDTLTNKTLSGNTAVTLISGSGTLTLNTSGTATIPNGTDTLVNLTGTQTLTGKTISFPTTGGTPTALNYYEEGTFTANFNQGAGASGTNTSYTVNFTRVGKMVTLVFPSVQPTAGATAATFSTASSTVPATLRPTTSGLFWMNIGKINGADSATPLQTGISTAGVLSVQRDGAGVTTFTSGSVSGPYAFTMSYTIQ